MTKKEQLKKTEAAPIIEREPEPDTAEQSLSPEQLRLERLRQACEQLEQEATEILRSEYPPGEFPFHNLEHSRGVANNAEAILKVIQEIDPNLVSDEDILFVRVEAMRHDIPQDRKNFEGQDYNPKTQMIVRSRGYEARTENYSDEDLEFPAGNEEAAGNQLIQVLREHPDRELFEEFAEDEISLDVGATLPEFYLNTLPDQMVPERMQGESVFTMTQPFAQECGIRGLALALADLKEPGGRIVDQERPHSIAFKAGNDEFRELYKGCSLRVQEILDDDLKIEDLDPEERLAIIDKILGWKRSQEGFYLGQAFDLEQILEHNPAIAASDHAEEIRDALRERYNGFQTIGQGLRTEYMTLASELGVTQEIDGTEIPLIELIPTLEKNVHRISGEIEPYLEKEEVEPLSPQDAEIVAVLKREQAEAIDQLTEAVQQRETILKNASPVQFMKAIRAIGYE